MEPLSSIDSSIASKVLDKEPSLQPFAKRKHIKFGREEPPKSPLQDHNINEVAETEDQLPKSIRSDVESEDEAPETLTAMTGLNQARLAINEASKVVQR